MLRASLKTAAREMVVGENCIMGIIVWEYSAWKWLLVNLRLLRRQISIFNQKMSALY